MFASEYIAELMINITIMLLLQLRLMDVSPINDGKVTSRTLFTAEIHLDLTTTGLID